MMHFNFTFYNILVQVIIVYCNSKGKYRSISSGYSEPIKYLVSTPWLQTVIEQELEYYPVFKLHLINLQQHFKNAPRIINKYKFQDCNLCHVLTNYGKTNLKVGNLAIFYSLQI